MKNFGRLLLPVIIIFIAINILVFMLRATWTDLGFDTTVLAGANLLFFGVSLLVFMIQKSALNNPNPNVFIRSVISGMMIKMFSCAIAVVAYVVLKGNTYSKRSVFAALILYLFYLGAEVGAVMQLNKKKNG